MQSINVVNNNQKTRALLIPKNEWTRLKKILTKKDEDKAEVELRKQLKDERLATSKAISESWATTVLNKRKKGHEDKLKLLAFKEARQHEKDEIIKLKILKRRNAIVEKALLKKWLDRDSTKALNRAVHKVEVIRERSMQMEFNEAQKAKELEADRLLKIEQNLDAERYKTDRREQKLKQAETKKTYAAVLLNELKERETIKSDNVVKLREEGKAELQRIANEIAEDIKNKKAKALTTKENLFYHMNESRKIKAENIKRRQLEDKKENVLISIMAEAKKKMARKRKLKEIEILKERQLKSEKLVKTITNNNQDKEEIAFQNAIEEKEQKYQEEELKKKVWMKKRKEDFENNKKILDEENRKEKERLTLSYQWEMERNLRETEMLRSLETSRKQAKTREMNRFREDLNLQRDNNRAATRANKQVDIEEYNAQLKLWQQQDEEFMTYNKNLIDKYKKDGISVIPLIKAIETYDQDIRVNTMDHLEQGWFTESETWPGAGLSLQVDKVLHKEKSQYQDIMILQTKSFGKALILDNIIQCTEFDEFSYQEMISFLPLCSHPNPERVLVVGGGDGGVAREAVKHPKVLSVDVVEIDERVVKLSEQYLPFMACGFKHDKVTLHIEDGFEFMQNNAQRFDIIITDSSDPVGPNESLFQKTYIESLKRSLKPGGIICSQVGSIWIKEDQDTMIRLSKDCSANFKKVTLATISIPSYPTGNISFILATDNELVNFKVPAYSFTLEELNDHKLKHYSPDVHSSSFSIPRFARMIIPHINC